MSNAGSAGEWGQFQLVNELNLAAPILGSSAPWGSTVPLQAGEYSSSYFRMCWAIDLLLWHPAFQFFKSWLIMINDEQQCVDEWCCQKSYFYPKDHYFASLRHFHCNSATPREAKTGHLQLPCLAESRASLKGTCTAWFFLVLFRCSGLHMELRKVSWVCPAPYRGRAFHILPISQSFIICKAICIEHVREHSEHCIEYVLNSYKFIVLGRLRSLKKN